jgi:hypothetical protein
VAYIRALDLAPANSLQCDDPSCVSCLEETGRRGATNNTYRPWKGPETLSHGNRTKLAKDCTSVIGLGHDTLTEFAKIFTPIPTPQEAEPSVPHLSQLSSALRMAGTMQSSRAGRFSKCM